MNSIEEISFKKLETKLEEIADYFFYAKRKISEINYEDSKSYFDFLNRVERAYSKLNDIEKNLINNEFFFQEYSQWWVPLYSKATFYHYKKETMQRFLEAFYAS